MPSVSFHKYIRVKGIFFLVFFILENEPRCQYENEKQSLKQAVTDSVLHHWCPVGTPAAVWAAALTPHSTPFVTFVRACGFKWTGLCLGKQFTETHREILLAEISVNIDNQLTDFICLQ